MRARRDQWVSVPLNYSVATAQNLLGTYGNTHGAQPQLGLVTKSRFTNPLVRREELRVNERHRTKTLATRLRNGSEDGVDESRARDSALDRRRRPPPRVRTCLSSTILRRPPSSRESRTEHAPQRRSCAAKSATAAGGGGRRRAAAGRYESCPLARDNTSQHTLLRR